jgi:hypothetical protein
MPSFELWMSQDSVMTAGHMLPAEQTPLIIKMQTDWSMLGGNMTTSVVGNDDVTVKENPF